MSALPRLFLLLALPLLTPYLAQASDLAKEKRWAEQVVPALFDGEPVWLEAGGVEFLGIHTDTDGAERAALVLHGIGVHPDWPQVVNPLRVGLAENGWTTLALQMPVLPNEAATRDYLPLFDEVGPRIEAGIAYLEAQGARDIVIVAHSLGATMASHYLSGHPDAVRAFVGIGMSGGSGDPRLDNVQSLAHIRVPVLDLYGSEDLEAVVSSADARAEAARRAGNAAYVRKRVEGADHFFAGQEETLLDTVTVWLDATLRVQ